MRLATLCTAPLAIVLTIGACSEGCSSRRGVGSLTDGTPGRVWRDRAAAAASDGGSIVRIAAAGDISLNSLGAQRQTSDLIGEAGVAAVLVLGDTQYPNGELANFKAYYDPTWGRFKAITEPSPGNHEYYSDGAEGYYAYFGDRAGDPTKGYYSFDLGEWHLISLNSNCGDVGCGATSPQLTWLKADLAANTRKCVLAYWHHPRFSSGATHGNNPSMGPFWDALYQARVDVVLNGHEHIYERFHPQTPAALPDAAGIRQFTVGTGGANLYAIDSIQPNSAVRYNGAHGVLALTLAPDSYHWKFLPVAPATFTDTGSAVCH